MELTRAYTFNAPRARVWDLLMDTTAISACLPGARGLKPIGPDQYEAELTATVAAVTGNFKAVMALQDQQPPDAYRIVLDANGRPGFVRGQASVTLVEEGVGTRVQIVATADIGGKIARVGQRLLEGVARMTMDRFFACLAGRLEQPEGTD